MKTPAAPTNAAIARYLAGDSPPTEVAEIERWMAADPAHRAHVDALRSIWIARAPDVAWDMDGMWSAIQRRGADSEPRRDSAAAPSRSVTPPPARHRPRVEILGGSRGHWVRIPLAIAAALLVLGGGARLYLGGVWSYRHSIPVAASTSAPAHEYVTTRGQRASIQLADGSHVTLAPESRLRVDPEFGGAAREVALEGEAIFEVVHDAAHPFRVRSGSAVVQDVGTRFDVRAYAADSSVVVAVQQGSVTLGLAPAAQSGTATPAHAVLEGIVLSAGQVGRVDGSGRVSTATHIKLARYFGWSDGRLVFSDEPLPNVLRAVGRWYDLDIRVGDQSLARRLVTAEFSTDDPSEVIDALATAVDARVDRAGRVVTFTAR